MSASRLRSLSAASLRTLPGGRRDVDELVVLGEFAEAQWGFAGVGWYGSSVRGYAVFAPPTAIEAELGFDPDAAVLIELWTSPGMSVRRSAKELTRHGAARLLRSPRRVAAIEAAPTARFPRASAALLQDLGFNPTDRELILRLDLNSTVLGFPALGEWRDRLTAWLTPTSPETAQRVEQPLL